MGSPRREILPWWLGKIFPIFSSSTKYHFKAQRARREVTEGPYDGVSSTSYPLLSAGFTSYHLPLVWGDTKALTNFSSPQKHQRGNGLKCRFLSAPTSGGRSLEGDPGGGGSAGCSGVSCKGASETVNHNSFPFAELRCRQANRQ